MTLVALFAMTTGAWADEATITLKCGTTEKTYENVTLPWSTTADILKAVVTDINFNININAISGGDGKVVKYGNENFTVTGTFSGEATVVVSYNMGSSATITVTAPGPLLTLNEAKTEATMESMPTYDVNFNYELVRDMSVQMTTEIGDGNDGYRIRLQKNEQTGKYEPAEMTAQQMKELVKVHDAIENYDLTFGVLGANCIVNIYAANDENQAVGEPIAFADLTPGRYIAKAVAATGSAYEGETDMSNIFVLFEGYEVTVPAGEYVTYYKDEALYVEDENAQLYTITAVSGTTATATELNVAPANTPLLVKNNAAEAKTILLIPTTTDTPDNVEVYSGFKGTLEGTQIAASTDTQANYVCTGKQFTWVKDAGTIAANRCWLELVSSTGAPVLNIVFDGNATGIETTKFTDDANDAWYDLNGRRLQAKPTTKGVYILNGRKVVVK